MGTESMYKYLPLAARAPLQSSENLVRGGGLAKRAHLRLKRLLRVALLGSRVATVFATTLPLRGVTGLVCLLGNATALDTFVRATLLRHDRCC